MQGVPARVVMEILGHDQISTTMNIYAHVLPNSLREAAARIESLLAESGRSEDGETNIAAEDSDQIDEEQQTGE
jgi:hypothetical protein